MGDTAATAATAEAEELPDGFYVGMKDDPELHRAVRDRAKEEERDLSTVVRRALRLYLDQDGERMW